jgi:hypothetical protein
MRFFPTTTIIQDGVRRLGRSGLVVIALTLCASTLVAQTSTTATSPAIPKFTYTNTGKMSTYRNLAQLAYECYLKGEDDKAAALGKIIERTYDKTEGDLEKSSKDLYGKIDISMDDFIKPLMGYQKSGRPDPVKEQRFFEEYLKNLALAD